VHRTRLAAGLLAAALISAGPALARRTLPAEKPQGLAEPVAIRPLGEVALYPEREASAQVVALNESKVAAEIAARIEAIPVEVGQTVAKGVVLARLDCRDHELALERARAAEEASRARMRLSEHQLGRARELAAKGFYSGEALDARATELEVLRAEAGQARSQRAIAERSVGKCVVRSPYVAIVRQRLGQVGELASPGSALVALLDARHIEVAAQVQLRDAESLRRAAEARFTGDGGARALRLARISPAIDPQARTVEARLRFAGEPAAPGAAGRVHWRDRTPHVPPELLVRRNGRLGLFLDNAGAARFHPLPEAQEGRPAAVSLPPSTRLVVSGHLQLQDGQSLR
jgi:RND family efflux transporter MFP subunit